MKTMQQVDRVAMPMVVALALSALAAADARGRPMTAGAGASSGAAPVARPAPGKGGWDLSDLETTGRAAHVAGIGVSPGRRPSGGLMGGLLVSGARAGW